MIGDTRISLTRKSSQVASLLIDAPKSVKITIEKAPGEHKKEQETREQAE